MAGRGGTRGVDVESCAAVEAHAPGGQRGYVGSMERGRGQQSASERAGRGERSVQVAGAGDGGAPHEA